MSNDTKKLSLEETKKLLESDDVAFLIKTLLRDDITLDEELIEIGLLFKHPQIQAKMQALLQEVAPSRNPGKMRL